MAITTKKPAEKLTVGAQYICFDTASDGTYSGTYAEDVTCLPTVTQVEVTDTGDDFKDYASGDVYASGTRTMYKQIKTTNLAFEDALIAKMKGDVVDDTSGVIMESGPATTAARILPMGSTRRRMTARSTSAGIPRSSTRRTRTALRRLRNPIRRRLTTSP